MSAWADLGSQGVTLVGEIPPGLPSLEWPAVSLGDVAKLAPSAVGIALVAFSDAILTARSLARPGERPVDADQEMIGLAGLNLMAGLSQSFPVGSSGSRSAVNVRVGGRTQVVSITQAASVALVLLFLTAPLSLLPKATLAAVIIFAAIGLVDVGGWKALVHGSRAELVVAVVTVVGMLTVGLLPALVIAVLLSILDVVRRSAQPRDAVLGWSPKNGRFVDVRRRKDAQVVPGVVVYRLDDRLFFANSPLLPVPGARGHRRSAVRRRRARVRRGGGHEPRHLGRRGSPPRRRGARRPRRAVRGRPAARGVRAAGRRPRTRRRPPAREPVPHRAEPRCWPSPGVDVEGSQ